jgi:hypothetical protein
MSKRQLCPYVDGSQNNFHLRLAGILSPLRPTPRHDDASRPVDDEKLSAALVLHARDRPEAKPIAPTDARIGLREKNRAGIRAPPLRNAFSRRYGLEHDVGRCLDAAYKSKTGHFFWPRASAPLRSAYAASLSNLVDQKSSRRRSHAMAPRMDPGLSRTVTTRPDFERLISPASSRTPRCFITAGSLIAKGSANSLTVAPSRCASLSNIARRVGSPSAAKVRSRLLLLFSIMESIN